MKITKVEMMIINFKQLFSNLNQQEIPNTKTKVTTLDKDVQEKPPPFSEFDQISLTTDIIKMLNWLPRTITHT